MRVIKKYPNRRLYDAAASRYVTLEDIRQLVLNEIPFRVVDRRTDANITRSVLLQVIAEQEQREPALLSETFLAQLIRASGGSMAVSVKEFLDRNMTQYLGARTGAGGVPGERPAGV